MYQKYSNRNNLLYGGVNGIKRKKIKLLKLLKEVSIKVRDALKYRGDDVEIPASHWMIMSVLEQKW